MCHPPTWLPLHHRVPQQLQPLRQRLLSQRGEAVVQQVKGHVQQLAVLEGRWGRGVHTCLDQSAI